MAKFTIQIVQTFEKEITITAESEEKALEIAENQEMNLFENDVTLDSSVTCVKKEYSQSEWLLLILKAYNQFCFENYNQKSEIAEIPKNKLLGVAFTEELTDYEERYYYGVQCTLDLEKQLDIYEMFNEYIQVTVITKMTYESMLENLTNSDFDDWVSCVNGIDYDELSELIDMNVNGEETNVKIDELCKSEHATITINILEKG